MAQTAVLRTLDANFNRLREGLRVIEEIARLVNNHADHASSLKTLRHQVTRAFLLLPRDALLTARDSENDVGRSSAGQGEMTRHALADLLTANFKRCQEAARVIEEFGKLVSPEASLIIKEVRFQLYTLEKKACLTPPATTA